MGEVDVVKIPRAVRLRLGRAAVQTLADSAGADLLHIKGDAVDLSLRPAADPGSDIDVLTRPAHVAALDAVLRAHGWQLYSTFHSGSPFGHAQTYIHDIWGYLDLHRSFPGIRCDADRAFTVMSAGGGVVEFGGVPCAVPHVTAQALILILNSARSPARGARDLAAAWNDASLDHRGAIAALVVDLDCPVAFAAATGRLDDHQHERDYLLWKTVTEGGSRAAEWWGRVRAQPTLMGSLRTAARATLVNSDRLGHVLGRPPTRREVVREFFARPERAIAELWHAARDRSRS
ncbi:2-nitropropane dioxygenase [Microbacterium lacus]|uniref:2-nitropropane dioxygenase n=1 Tax=Microbacterium lacus TaxID=415217 RepID=UPI00384F58F1